MTNTLIQIKIQERLNKLSSNDYGNIECWQVVEAFNKGMDMWVRRQLQGINQTRTGPEGSIRRIDDLQVLLKEWNTTWANSGLYWETSSIPTDYLQYCRITAYGQDECKDCPPRRLEVFEGNEADVDIYLADQYRAPDYSWRTTFSTMAGNKFKIWTNGSFNIVDPVLLYYKTPVHIQIANCRNPDTGTVSPVDVLCEFPDSVIEILCDEAAGIIAGDTDAFNLKQRLDTTAEHNT